MKLFSTSGIMTLYLEHYNDSKTIQTSYEVLEKVIIQSIKIFRNLGLEKKNF